MGWKLTQQRAEPRTEEAVCRTKDDLAKRGEGDSLATAIILGGGALNPACAFEGAHELRDRRTGDAGTAREVSRAQRLGCDRAEGRELTERQRRFVAGEQPLDPTACKWSNPDEGFDRGLAAARAWHS